MIGSPRMTAFLYKMNKTCFAFYNHEEDFLLHDVMQRLIEYGIFGEGSQIRSQLRPIKFEKRCDQDHQVVNEILKSSPIKNHSI